MARAIEVIGSLRGGDPFGDVDVGALISRSARDQVGRVIDEVCA